MSSTLGLFLKSLVVNAAKRKNAEKSAEYRTSTKALAGGAVGSQIYLALVDLISNEAIVAFLTTDSAIALAAVLIAAVFARFSKTPKEVGKI